VLDARGAISVTERAGMILSIRKLACAIAAKHVTPPESEKDAESTPAGT
jgi:glycyl-tRNA synthetase alpha subunit